MFILVPVVVSTAPGINSSTRPSSPRRVLYCYIVRLDGGYIGVILENVGVLVVVGRLG